MGETCLFATLLNYSWLRHQDLDHWWIPVSLENHVLKHIHSSDMTHTSIRDRLMDASETTLDLMGATIPKVQKRIREDSVTGMGYVRFAAWRRPSPFHKGIRHLRALVHAQFELKASAKADPDIPFPNGRPSEAPLVMTLRLLDVHTQPDEGMDANPLLDLCGAALCSDLIHHLDPPLQAIRDLDKEDGLHRAPYSVLFRFSMQGDLSDNASRTILASTMRHFVAACERMRHQPGVLRDFLVDEDIHYGLEELDTEGREPI